MTKFTVSTMALMAALSLPTAAIAQTSNEQQQVPQTQEQAQPTNNQAPDVKTAENVKIKGLITLQDKDTFLASDLTGATVYSPQDEAIGDVNDVIVSRDGKVDGIIVGVGGFLGVGEKDVAIKMSQVKMMDTDTGVKLVLDMNKDQLTAAPEFKSKADMQAEINAKQPASTQGLMAPDQPPAEGTKTQQ
jgi:sporulation protein YlmC with PRC-barrel domain